MVATSCWDYCNLWLWLSYPGLSIANVEHIPLGILLLYGYQLLFLELWKSESDNNESIFLALSPGVLCN